MAEPLHDRREREPDAAAPEDVEPDSEAVDDDAESFTLPDVGDELPVLSFTQERLRQVLAENQELRNQLDASVTEAARLREIVKALGAESGRIDRHLMALEREIGLARQEAVSAKADSDRLRALLEKESVARRGAEAQLAEVRSLAKDLRDAEAVVARMREEVHAERQAHRATQTELKSTKSQLKQVEAASQKRIDELRVSHATLEEQVSGVQRELEIRGAEIEAKEVEVNRRLAAIRTLEGDLVARRTEIERREIALEKATSEIEEGWAQIGAHQEELDRWRKELEAEEENPRVIRLDEVDESHVDDKELVALLVAERQQHGITEAELLRVRERAALLEHELKRMKEKMGEPSRSRRFRR